MSNVDTLLGLPAAALAVHDQRNTLLANNLANADTPGFKARDIDFRSVLSAAKEGSSESLTATRDRHVSRALSSVFPNSVVNELQYRVPMQNSLDGNTVESDIEQAAYAENSVRYQAALRFVDGRAKSLLSAIRGE
ncbi:MAG: flagellar basal body rod protein FlgB [Gammaproteobacteria bacterium]